MTLVDAPYDATSDFDRYIADDGEVVVWRDIVQSSVRLIQSDLSRSVFWRDVSKKSGQSIPASAVLDTDGNCDLLLVIHYHEPEEVPSEALHRNCANVDQPWAEWSGASDNGLVHIYLASWRSDLDEQLNAFGDQLSTADWSLLLPYSGDPTS